mmetsp:Transcript_83011/g.201356  ORF Transcript_83011/g.201356 Transcript_83011/m.201356 type:complete len:275 (+) Transcript_83011:57-881(+)
MLDRRVIACGVYPHPSNQMDGGLSHSGSPSIHLRYPGKPHRLLHTRGLERGSRRRVCKPKPRRHRPLDARRGHRAGKLGPGDVQESLRHGVPPHQRLDGALGIPVELLVPLQPTLRLAARLLLLSHLRLELSDRQAALPRVLQRTDRREDLVVAAFKVVVHDDLLPVVRLVWHVTGAWDELLEGRPSRLLCHDGRLLRGRSRAGKLLGELTWRCRAHRAGLGSGGPRARPHAKPRLTTPTVLLLCVDRLAPRVTRLHCHLAGSASWRAAPVAHA